MKGDFFQHAVTKSVAMKLHACLGAVEGGVGARPQRDQRQLQGAPRLGVPAPALLQS